MNLVKKTKQVFEAMSRIGENIAFRHSGKWVHLTVTQVVHYLHENSYQAGIRVKSSQRT